MIITEPRWKSLIVETTSPIFTPEQCQLIINAGRSEPVENGQVGGGQGGTVDTKVRTSHISWIPFNKIIDYKTHINSIWINEMKANEYNPVHVHQGNLFTGLSSVMVLKLPNTYGVEYSAENAPQNGKLQILGSSSGQFAKVDYEPPMKLRDFYIFPYDMRHCVYPFNGTNETRRTLAANCDVLYNPIMNRGAQ